MLSLILLPNLCITLLQFHAGFLKNPHLVSQRSKLSPVPKQLLCLGMLLFPEYLTLIHSLKRLHLCFPQSGLFFLLKLCILRSFFPFVPLFPAPAFVLPASASPVQSFQTAPAPFPPAQPSDQAFHSKYPAVPSAASLPLLQPAPAPDTLEAQPAAGAALSLFPPAESDASSMR